MVPFVGDAVAEPLLWAVMDVVVVSRFFSKHLSSPKGLGEKKKKEMKKIK